MNEISPTELMRFLWDYPKDVKLVMDFSDVCPGFEDETLVLSWVHEQIINNRAGQPNL